MRVTIEEEVKPATCADAACRAPVGRSAGDTRSTAATLLRTIVRAWQQAPQPCALGAREESGVSRERALEHLLAHG